MIFPEGQTEFKTDGEEQVYELLSQLDDNFRVFYADKRADFVIVQLNPAKLFTIEVKDWSFSKYNSEEKFFKKVYGPQDVCPGHPLQQAKSFMDKIRGAIDRKLQGQSAKYSDLRHQAGKFIGKLKFPFSYGCLFTNITKEELERKSDGGQSLISVMEKNCPEAKGKNDTSWIFIKEDIADKETFLNKINSLGYPFSTRYQISTQLATIFDDVIPYVISISDKSVEMQEKMRKLQVEIDKAQGELEAIVSDRGSAQQQADEAKMELAAATTAAEKARLESKLEEAEENIRKQEAEAKTISVKMSNIEDSMKSLIAKFQNFSNNFEKPIIDTQPQENKFYNLLYKTIGIIVVVLAITLGLYSSRWQKQKKQEVETNIKKQSELTVIHPNPILKPSEVNSNHIGKNIWVQGTVSRLVRGRDERQGLIYIKFKDDEAAIFQITVTQTNYRNWGVHIRGRDVKVSGILEEYQGYLEIKVRRRNRIQILE